MKLHLQTPDAHLVTGLGDGWVKVGTTEHRVNCVLTPDAVHEGFAPQGLAALTAADFRALLDYDPEIVLLGTGATQHFPHPRETAPLAEAHVGIEVMDTRAACRTYNILAAEGRRVVAALIVEATRP
jgi:uncharacterized protein